MSRDGVVGEPGGVLEDYACVAEGFLTLFAATGDAEWFEHAERLVGQVLERFGDGEGGFFDTAVDAEALVARPRDATDNATPSGSGHDGVGPHHDVRPDRRRAVPRPG